MIITINSQYNKYVANKRQAILVYILIFAFVLVLINSSFFLHLHRMENGRIMVHSHPFSHNEQPNEATHRHSQSQLYFIQALNTILAIFIFLLFFLFSNTDLTSRGQYIQQLPFIQHATQKRAPPVMI